MKRRITRLTALVMATLFALSLTSCGGRDTADETTAAPTPTAEETVSVQDVPETAQNGTAQDVYRAEFAQQLATLRAQYGAMQGEYAMEKKGVLFADLLDWDGDGTPELFTITHAGIVREHDTFRLAVYGAADAAADVAVVPLLDTVVGSSYGFLSSDLCAYITCGSDGVLTLCVDDSHEFADIKETYYTLSEGKVHSTVLTAQSSVGGWEEDGDDTRPVDPDAYQIDGAACSKDAFDVRRSALGRDDGLTLYCQNNYDTAALDAFLTAQSDVYSGGALLEASRYMDDAQPRWLQDVLFTVGA